MLLALLPACAAPPPPGLPAAFLGAWPPPTPPATTTEPIRPAIPAPTCSADADCGYDPASDRCLADPRANRQPPIVDQGIVCYCEERRCGTLHVPPVPCESDASCAVRADPRPHPVAADAVHPHVPCRKAALGTTCERTNICTLHRHPCPRP